MGNIVALQNIESLIFNIRGIQVMIDRDLSELYNVETKRINEHFLDPNNPELTVEGFPAPKRVYIKAKR